MLSKYLLLVALMFGAFCISSVAQTATVKTWTKGDACCTYDIDDGWWFTSYQDSDVIIEVMSGRFGIARGDFEVINVTIKNRGLPRFDLTLKDFVLRITIPKEKVVQAVDPYELAKWQTDRSDTRYKIERRAAQNETTTGTVKDNNGNSATIRIQSPNEKRVEEIDRKQAEVEEAREDRADRIKSSSLKSNTLFPGKVVDGVLWFRKTKKSTGGFLEITLSGTTYRIPLQDELK